ncbi:MAG: hypothetical protein ABR508_04240 [Candidatus Baltobacteraceae bacterium]
MRSNNWFGTAMFVFVVVFVICGLVFFRWHDFEDKAAVHRVLTSRSVLDFSLKVQYGKPPVYNELYHLHNDNGTSSAQYRIQGYSGKVVTITLPPDKTYAVTFLFQELVQDGIWQLTNKPDAGNTDAHYTLHVFQVADKEQGSRTITFTDPHYWAVTAGRQYHIALSRNGPTPDLTKLESTSIADPRFENIVTAFRTFGPASFRARVRQARNLIASSR